MPIDISNWGPVNLVIAVSSELSTGEQIQYRAKIRTEMAP
jgi:hypothetical protein